MTIFVVPWGEATSEDPDASCLGPVQQMTIKTSMATDYLKNEIVRQFCLFDDLTLEDFNNHIFKLYDNGKGVDLEDGRALSDYNIQNECMVIYGSCEFYNSWVLVDVKNLTITKEVFEDWKIAYDCLTDPESSSDEEKKLTRYINTLANPRYGMDGFIGGIFRFISFHFCFVLETQLISVINALVASPELPAFASASSSA